VHLVVVMGGGHFGGRLCLLGLALVAAAASDGDDESEEYDGSSACCQTNDPPLGETTSARRQPTLPAGTRTVIYEVLRTIEKERIAAFIRRVAAVEEKKSILYCFVFIQLCSAAHSRDHSVALPVRKPRI